MQLFNIICVGRDTDEGVPCIIAMTKNLVVLFCIVKLQNCNTARQPYRVSINYFLATDNNCVDVTLNAKGHIHSWMPVDSVENISMLHNNTQYFCPKHLRTMTRNVSVSSTVTSS